MDTVEPAVLARQGKHGACERHYGAKPFGEPNNEVQEGGAQQRNRPGERAGEERADAGGLSGGPFQTGCRLGTDGYLGRTGKCAENVLNSKYADYFPAP